MKDLLSENLIPLLEAAKLVPPGRNGRPTHVSTIFRWARAGIRGVRLEAVRLGGRWLTTREALARFAERLTAASGPSGEMAVPTPAVSSASLHAEQELRRLGI